MKEIREKYAALIAASDDARKELYEFCCEQLGSTGERPLGPSAPEAGWEDMYYRVTNGMWCGYDKIRYNDELGCLEYHKALWGGMPCDEWCDVMDMDHLSAIRNIRW